jgi:serine/threonine protein kinase
MATPTSDDDSLSSGETRVRDHAVPASPLPEPNAARFTPGQLIGERYRIVSLLAQGGMGEVYRADDTRLGHPVALKYVPHAVSENPDALQRLYAEVRIGRQISHPNVCRLYDVVEIAGQHFIAMEYVDGEDLASLLRRIGRLPGDKAVALARDICAGLSAAHDRGVIHRDLKPGNVMIDGRGSARITDFGLAALTGDDNAHRDFAGTPAYMAPEQLNGGALTTRSDIYALGVLLFEMFTGRRLFQSRTLEALREEHSAAKSRPSSVVREIDPAVERVILRCLEETPAQRPSSIHAVMAALPGGDPLQAALDAGETPSPAMVAAAGRIGDLSVKHGWLLFLSLLVFLLAATWTQSRSSMESLLPRIKSRDALADRARELIAKFGGEEPNDVDFGYGTRVSYMRHLERVPQADRWERLRKTPPSALLFNYRQSPRPLVGRNERRRVFSDDPPETAAGMASVILDAEGRLVRFRRVPHAEARAGAADWPALFTEAGLDFGRFRRSEPLAAIGLAHDARLAWVGPMPGIDGQMRVEAAMFRGAAVFFELYEPWRPVSNAPAEVASGGQFFGGLFMVIAIFTAVLARRNLLRGRSDRRGALRIAVVVAATTAAGLLSVADHTINLAAEWVTIVTLCGTGLFFGVLAWMFYLAVEPYLRRRWPHMLISWSRVLDGRLRDPLVGRDVLLGLTTGTLTCAIWGLTRSIEMMYAGAAGPAAELTHISMQTPHGIIYTFTYFTSMGITYALGWVALVLLFRLIVRNNTAAFVMLVLVMGAVTISDAPRIEYPLSLLMLTPLAFVMRRVGVLALATAFMAQFGLDSVPLTLDLTQWFALRSSAVLLIFALLGAWAFRVALAGKPAFGSMMAEEEEEARTA